MAYPYRLFAWRTMSEADYTSEHLTLYSSSIELFFSSSLLDLLDTIGPFAKHTLSLHHDWPSFDHTHGYLADRELLHFLHADPCHLINNSKAHGWTSGLLEIA